MTVARTRPGASRNRSGFSLIELVIVVVIIGIIAAIAIPRMSRGSEGAAESALSGNLSVLRSAIDLYYSEHGDYPKVANFVNQMKQYSDVSGGTSATKDATHIYGPYLRELPPLPVGDLPARTSVKVGAKAAPAADDGWAYDESTGDIRANSAKNGANGQPYNTW
jgi:prepilin-type N-terminal cleavage/methylation domain-containing protein